MNIDTISIVVPTLGTRPKLLSRAIASIDRQINTCKLEIIVVADYGSSAIIESPLRAQLTHAALRIHKNLDSRLSARAIGVKVASGNAIAFLDDDDYWHPRKLALQTAILSDIENSGRHGIVSCRVHHVYEDANRRSVSTPAKLIKPGQAISDYLFLHRSPLPSRSSLFTSTLLVSAAVAHRVQWRRIPRHQDWDWLVRAEITTRSLCIQHPRALVGKAVGSTNSISASNNWQASLVWAQSTLRRVATSQTYADFLSAQTLRYAINACSIQGVQATLDEIRSTHKIPSASTWPIAAAGILPRSLFESLMKNVQRRT